MRKVLAALFWFGVAALPDAAMAQSFPQRPIRLIVPFPAGGPTDIIARLVTQVMGDRLGQPIVIENRGGAGGVIGTDAVAKAAPDGYTLGLSSSGALALSPSLQKMPYQSTKDLTPITLVARVPELLVVPSSLPVKNLAELIALAKSQPGGLNYASTGPGGMPQLAVELIKSAAKVDIVHVPYAGAAPAMNDLLPGRVQMMFADVPVELPHVLAGTLRPIAIGSPQRLALLPDVPTMSEAGLNTGAVENWYGLVGPAKLPADVLAKLQSAAVEAIHDSEVQKTLGGLGAILVGDSPAEFTAFIDAETAKWAQVIRAAGVKIE